MASPSAGSKFTLMGYSSLPLNLAAEQPGKGTCEMKPLDNPWRNSKVILSTAWHWDFQQQHLTGQTIKGFPAEQV